MTSALRREACNGDIKEVVIKAGKNKFRETEFGGFAGISPRDMVARAF
jgi:hypothetical protein